ncbi:hypothetical protein GUJ93_ZPchr0004g38803 [Zizania palustris]|uniref:Uncharacterized protein n=1 Tax=Zizania palustris TaxID=103762 RepID=A0A8J5RZR0_ZIZPA|nr:hypothetical protein GUJ93_ZPchr0004g38803 [Zizania palustris]
MPTLHEFLCRLLRNTTGVAANHHIRSADYRIRARTNRRCQIRVSVSRVPAVAASASSRSGRKLQIYTIIDRIRVTVLRAVLHVALHAAEPCRAGCPHRARQARHDRSPAQQPRTAATCGCLPPRTSPLRSTPAVPGQCVAAGLLLDRPLSPCVTDMPELLADERVIVQLDAGLDMINRTAQGLEIV